VRLLTNNPDKVAQLEGYGVQIAERVPLVVGVTAQNTHYLETKRDRMGHLLPQHVAERDVAVQTAVDQAEVDHADVDHADVDHAEGAAR